MISARWNALEEVAGDYLASLPDPLRLERFPAVAVTCGKSNRMPRILGFAFSIAARRMPCAPPTSTTF